MIEFPRARVSVIFQIFCITFYAILIFPPLVSGLTLAVFRDENDEVHALDAYCPHLGANLAVGGQVKGDCLECPFHGWQFRGSDGKCTHIPYSEKGRTVKT